MEIVILASLEKVKFFCVSLCVTMEQLEQMEQMFSDHKKEEDKNMIYTYLYECLCSISDRLSKYWMLFGKGYVSSLSLIAAEE